MDSTSPDFLARALDAIDPSLCDYDTWLRVGMGLHAERAPLEMWDEWSRGDPRRYHPGECARKWAGFSHIVGGVTGATIVALARSSSLGSPKDSGLARHDGRETDSGRRDRTPEQQLSAYLNALFQPDEFVGYVCDSRLVRNGTGEEKYRPASCGTFSCTAGRLADMLAKRTLEEVIGTYDAKAGAWIRINPLDGMGARDRNVAAFRHALVESDELPFDRQLSIIESLDLPAAAIVSSGDRSVHAIVRVDARDADEYRTRVDALYAACDKAGLAVDRQNRNPSRLSRLPGAKRGEKVQTLVHVNGGPSSWDEWARSQRRAAPSNPRSSFPPIEHALPAVSAMPSLAPPLIEGVLRQGHKMLLAGPSKAGKSFALLELCMAISTGTAWLGKRCAQGRVLYVNLEVDRSSCLHRIEDVRKARRFGVEALDGIDIWNLRGRSYSPQELMEALVERAVDGGYRAIVIDPLYKLLTGDENSAHDMAELCSLLDRVCSLLKSAVVCCHHHSKGSQGWKAAPDRASGSGVLARDADALLDLIELDVPEEIRDACGVGESVTAWRVEGTLREFPSRAPIDVWFNHPLHLLDESRQLAGCRPKEALPPHFKGGRSTKARHERENEAKARQVARVCAQLDIEKNGEPFMIGDLIARLGWSRNTVKKHLDAAEGWKRIELNENTTIVQKERASS